MTMKLNPVTGQLDMVESGTGAGDLLAANNLGDVANAATSFDNIKQDATETKTGVSEKATGTECVTGTDTDRIVTPAGLTARLEAPGNIGGTTPAEGTFTDVELSGMVQGAVENNLNSFKFGADVLSMMTDPRLLNVMCEDPTTSDLIDISGKGHDGSPVGSWVSTDREKVGRGWGLNFNGTDAYYNFGDNDDFSFGDGSNDSPFSITIVVDHNIIGGSYQRFLNKADTTAATMEWILDVNTSNKIRMLLIDQSGVFYVYATTTNQLTTGIHSITSTYDGRGGATATNGINIYLDGVIQSVIYTNNASYVAMENAASLLTIGAGLLNSVIDSPYSGNINMAGIDAAEWSASDVWGLYQKCLAQYSEDGVSL